MKYVLLVGIACSILLTAAVAKDKKDKSTTHKLYVRLGTGYAIAHAGQTIGGITDIYSGSQTYSSSGSSFEVKKTSFSSGLHTYAALGYSINKNLAFELGADMNILPEKHTYNYLDVSGSPSISKTTTQTSIFPVFIYPSFVLNCGEGKSQLYARVGIAIPVYTDIKIEYASVSNQTTEQTIIARHSFSLGLTSALGYSYRFSDKIKLWAECSMLSISVYLKEWELTKYNIDGVDNLPQVTDKVISFISSGNTNSSGSSSSNNNYPTYALPFSDISFNAGVSISL